MEGYTQLRLIGLSFVDPRSANAACQEIQGELRNTQSKHALTATGLVMLSRDGAATPLITVVHSAGVDQETLDPIANIVATAVTKPTSSLEDTDRDTTRAEQQILHEMLPPNGSMLLVLVLATELDRFFEMIDSDALISISRRYIVKEQFTYSDLIPLAQIFHSKPSDSNAVSSVSNLERRSQILQDDDVLFAPPEQPLLGEDAE